MQLVEKVVPGSTLVQFCVDQAGSSTSIQFILGQPWLQLRLIEEKGVVNTRSNTCLTIKNKIKENKIIEDKLRLNNNKEHKLTREEIEIEIRKHQPKNDLPF